MPRRELITSSTIWLKKAIAEYLTELCFPKRGGPKGWTPPRPFFNTSKRIDPTASTRSSGIEEPVYNERTMCEPFPINGSTSY